jgi:hypothetical protein
MRRAAWIATMLLLASVGCGDDSYLIVTVDKRAAVHEAAKLKITLSNSGSMRTDDLDLAGHDFPVTFSLTAPGRGGELGISIDALDASGALVGRGTGQATLTDDMANVTLDSADFVINSEYAGNQYLTNDFEAVGLQLSATTPGTWMPVFRDDCTGTPPACDILGRRFDPAGLPVTSTLAAGTNQFKISTTLTETTAMPAVASSGVTTMVLWDYADTVGAGQGVACRVINESGAGTPAQLSISTEAADVVTAAPIGNGNFAVTWQVFDSTAGREVIHAMVIKPDCTAALTTTPTTVSVGATLTSLGHRRSHVAANGTSILYVWIADNEVRARPAMNSGALTGTEVKPVPKTASMDIDHVRIVPYMNTYWVGVRWAATDTANPGKIDVYKVDAMGNVLGTPTLITDKTGSDFASDKGFSMAVRSDGALMVVWHTCPSGPGSCDVFGRILRPSGLPVGEEFMIPTATGSDQVNPSVVALADSFVAAWNDSSQLDPDKSMSAVRARILYPPYDDARSVLGATCGASAPGSPNCGPGLLCATGSDQVQRCFQTCTPPSCPGGGTCSTVEGGSACTF